DALADLAAGDLRVPSPAGLPFDLVHHLLQHRHGDGPLLAGLHQTGQHLLPLEGLPAAVLLDDHERRLLPPLVGGNPAAAPLALAAAPDGRPFVGGPGVQHFAVAVVAVRAAHPGPSLRSLPLYTQRGAAGWALGARGARRGGRGCTGI